MEEEREIKETILRAEALYVFKITHVVQYFFMLDGHSK